MIIVTGIEYRIYRIEDKVVVSDHIVFSKLAAFGEFSTTDKIKDSFKLYVKRW